MAESHKSSLLPIKNRVLSVDEHTAFLAHYDLNEHDVLRGVKASGQTTSIDFSNSSFHVECQHAPHLNATTQVTVEAWINIKTYRAWSGIVSKGKEVSSYGIQMDNSTGKKIRFGAYPYSDITFIGNSDIPLNTWTHVCMTYNAGVVTAYVNGAQDGQGTVALKSLRQNTEPLIIGCDFPGGDEYFDGQIMRVKIWNRALSSDEIMQSMQNNIKIENGLLSCLMMDEGTGEVVKDRSPFHNDGIGIGTLKWTTGNSIFTLRPQEGRFGGGIAIEEGTTNMLSGTSLIFESGWGGIAGSTITRTQNYPFPEYKTNQATRFQTSGGTDRLKAVYQIICSATAGNIYTSQIKIKNIGAYNFILKDQYGQNELFKPGEYRYVTRTITHNGSSCFQFRFETEDIAHPIDIVAYQPQAEQKPFATSFVDESRLPPSLSYGDASQFLPKDQHTVMMWANPSSGSLGNIQAWNMCFSLSPAFYLGWDHSSYYRVSVVDANFTQQYVAYTGKSFAPNQWYYVGYTFNNGVLKLYLDGEKVGETTLSTNTIEYQRNTNETRDLFIGNYYGTGNNYAFNGIISELRIDKVARTEEEILAWYYSNSPFWPRGIYRKSY